MKCLQNQLENRKIPEVTKYPPHEGVCKICQCSKVEIILGHYKDSKQPVHLKDFH